MNSNKPCHSTDVMTEQMNSFAFSAPTRNLNLLREAPSFVAPALWRQGFPFESERNRCPARVCMHAELDLQRGS
jgi:hypothetical protein